MSSKLKMIDIGGLEDFMEFSDPTDTGVIDGNAEGFSGFEDSKEMKLALKLLGQGKTREDTAAERGLKSASKMGNRPWNLYKNGSYIATGLILSDAVYKIFSDDFIKRKDDEYYNENYSLEPSRDKKIDYYNQAVKSGIQYDGWVIYKRNRVKTLKKVVSKYLKGERPHLDKENVWHIEYCHKDPKHNNNQTALDKERELLNITGGQK